MNVRFASTEEAEALWDAEEGKEGILGKIVKFAGLEYTALSYTASTTLSHHYTLLRKVDNGGEILNVRATRQWRGLPRDSYYRKENFDSFSAYATSAKIIPLV